MATGTPVETGSLEDSAAGRLARELFAEVAQRLADEFGSVAATAVSAVAERQAPEPQPDQRGSLFQPGQMRRRLDQLIETNKRYGHAFGLVVFDVDGPGTRNGREGDSKETMLAVVGAALRDSVRIVDETFRLEDGAICVLAPNQTTVEGMQMTERLLRLLDELEAAGGLRISISAGVAACPEHGTDAEDLLRKADEAMWRARSLGQPVGVGALQDR